MREAGKPLRQVIAEVEELQFFCRFLAAANLAQVIHLAAQRCLSEVLRVSEKREMAFAEKCGNDAGDEQEQEEGRVEDEDGRKRDRCDGLLDQPAHLLDHGQPVGGLHARPLQAIVENRILIDRDIERRGLAHHFYAHVMGITIGEQVVEVIDGARE